MLKLARFFRQGYKGVVVDSYFGSLVSCNIVYSPSSARSRMFDYIPQGRSRFPRRMSVDVDEYKRQALILLKLAGHCEGSVNLC